MARIAEYLTWRYGQYPLQKYEMLTARRDARLLGYLIHHANGEHYIVADCSRKTKRFEVFCLGEAIAVARHHGAQTVSVPWPSAHPGKQLLEECGFRPRESSPVAPLALQRPTQRQFGPATDAWYLTGGDWEG